MVFFLQTGWACVWATAPAGGGEGGTVLFGVGFMVAGIGGGLAWIVLTLVLASSFIASWIITKRKYILFSKHTNKHTNN